MGTQQSGVLQLKIADVVMDKDLLMHARQIASILLKNDPLLSDSNNQPIKNAYNQIVKHKNIWNYIS
jgi:ATP-dependent DNA helicase RecG